MIGFITTPTTAEAILTGIKAAQETRGLPHYWSTGSYPIFTGAHAGKIFLPFDDEMMATNLRGGLTPADFPEFAYLVSALGGLDARVDLDPQAIIDPNAETL
jgi:hypothetical protein